MARIFYATNGDVVGVHPGPHEGNKKIQLHPSIRWIDVVEPPDQIKWPRVDGEAGTEKTTVVKNGLLEVRPGVVKTKKVRVEEMLRAHNLTIDDLRGELGVVPGVGGGNRT